MSVCSVAALGQKSPSSYYSQILSSRQGSQDVCHHSEVSMAESWLCSWSETMDTAAFITLNPNHSGSYSTAAASQHFLLLQEAWVSRHHSPLPWKAPVRGGRCGM